ncbi:nucleotidyltransferase domain-containing protein [Deinococcus radiomollis]|uniref:nucleotidyltransferase domain-containing protein n=1 Tax=Deinococcus radiomollis TaxID=468916 RepID=UPI00389167EC
MSESPVVTAVLEALVNHIRLHPHLLAAWLKGSQARGDADRHSDIDLHLMVSPEHAAVFREAILGWLAELYPVVRFHRLHPDWYSAIFEVGPETLIGLDLFLEPGEAPRLTRGHERLLWDRKGTLKLVEDTLPEPETLRHELDVAVRYFWALFLHLPGIERGELIPAVARLSHLTGQLIIVCGLGRGTAAAGGREPRQYLVERR